MNLKTFKLFTLLLALVMGIGSASAQETIFSMAPSVAETSAIASGTLAGTDFATVTGGKVTYQNDNTKEYPAVKGSMFYIGTSSAYFVIELDNALQTGDVISFSSMPATSNAASGVYIGTSATDKSFQTATDVFENVKFTVPEGLNGVSKIYINRVQGKTTTFSDLVITRGGASTDPTDDPTDDPASVEERIATWNFKAMEANAVSINGTTGTVPSDIEGVELAVNATSGKLVSRGGDAQFNQGAIISVPVRHAGDVVTVESYPGYHNYTVAGTAAANDTETYTAVEADATAGKVDIVATATAYLYSISVKQIAYSEGGDEGGEDIDPSTAHLLWDYTEAAPSAKPDNGLYYESNVNDAAGTKNGLKGVKMNSSGYAYFTKAAVKGTLKLTFGPRDGSKEIKLGVYSYASEPKAETLIEKTTGVTELQTLSIDLTAAQNNIYINRAEGAEGVLTKVEFVPFIERTFVDFKINFTKSWASSSTITEGTTYYVTATDADGVPTFTSEVPADGKYLCTFKGRYHNTGYGITANPVFSVPVDGAVKIYYGMNDYGADITAKNKAGETVLTGNSKGDKFSSDPANVMSMTYAKGEDVLTLTGGGYVPYFAVEACEVSPCTVTYKDQDGTVIKTIDTFEGETLGELPSAEGITVPAGSAFRGWFYASGVKAKATDLINGNTTVTAKVTPIETVEVGTVQTYNLASNIFYPEDHETISIEGGYYHDTQHGWALATDGKVSVDVAGNAQVVLSLCKYSKDAPITVTDAEGNVVTTIASAYNENDGALATVQYAGPATSLTFTFAQGESYLHKVTVYNVKDFLAKDETTGWYMVPAGDAAAFMLALNSANAETGATIFLPNGTYDLGEATGTTISGNNMSIIGESMEGTIIKNAPNVKSEGLGSADLFYNTSTGLYMQDLTLQNDLDYYNAGASGRAAVLQDNGNQTILRNVAMRSYQDTYYSKSGNYYFEGGLIQGTVDYICGGGNAWFENITLLNKSRSATAKSGDDTMTAYQGTGKYIFNNSSVESECSTFNFGRSWADAYVVYLNTTIKSGKLIDTRFNTTDMNSAPRFFGEYNTTDLSGNGKNTPASNHLTTTKGGDFESVLTADQAAEYTLASLFGSWDAKTIAAQVDADIDNIEDDALYLVEDEGEFVAIIKGSDFTADVINKTIRKANGRGGFGEPVKLEIKTVDVTIDEYKYITFYNESAVLIPGEDVPVYAKAVYYDENANKFVLADAYEPGDVIPAKTPVVLYSETPATYSLILNGVENAKPDRNDLLGSSEDTETSDLVEGDPDDYYYYALSLNQDNEIGFYWMNSEGAAFTNGAGKAFLAVKKSVFDSESSNSKAMGFAFNEGSNAIHNATSIQKTAKVYDITGREVKNPAKGVYIISGKKVVKL
ncbi:MAG: pectinesterase family protein [Bacteroidaceae bacterium]|nr:pectinesterase family protein [Bacteroidaceae bacterium]